MTFTTTRPASITTATEEIISIDWNMASKILTRLGYILDELNADSDYEPTNGAVSHQLCYAAIDNATTVQGYIYCDNGIYFTDGDNNYRHAEEAAMELIPDRLIYDAYPLINSEICELNYM
jgi:hypothetical protein